MNAFRKPLTSEYIVTLGATPLLCVTQEWFASVVIGPTNERGRPILTFPCLDATVILTGKGEAEGDQCASCCDAIHDYDLCQELRKRDEGE